MNFSKDSNKKKEKEYKSNKKRTKNKIGLVFLRIIFIALLILLFAGVGAGVGIFSGIIKSTPPIDVNQITPEGYATIIYDDNTTEIARLSGAEANREWVDIEDIPDNLEHAFVAMEDERFYEHNGIDIQAIMRAVVVNLQSKSFSEGGSTMTQQLIKNNILTSEKTLVRKIQEQYLSLMLEKELEQKYGKEEAKDIILENYLNTLNLGHGAFGVQAAAKTYFGKDVSELTAAECAVLAAIAPNPTKYDPARNPENNQDRQEIIVEKMFEQGYITNSDYQIAKAEEVYKSIQIITDESEGKNSFNSYYIDAVIEQVIGDLVDLGYSESTATDMIYRHGLEIYTTQDQDIQNTMETAMLNEELFPEEDFWVQLDYRLSIQHENGDVEHTFIPVYKDPDDNKGVTLFKTEEEAYAYIETFKSEKMTETGKIIGESITLTPQPQASMVIMDYRTGEIKALVGGRGEKIGNRTWNRAIDSTRSPGSTFKPLAAYAPALDTAGYTPATIIDDVPFTVEEAYPKPYTPNNWYATSRRDDWYWGLSTVRLGITQSMNILAVKTVYDIGLPTAFDYLQNFGFTTLVEADKGYSLPLGGLTNGVTNFEITAAYGAIANGGVYTEPILYTKVVDQSGNIILENQPETHTVMKDTTAFLLTNMMEDVIKVGTGGRAAFEQISMPISGKTGTAQESKDLWFVGYTPYYVAGIWTGYDREMPILNNNYYHLDLWQAVMEKVHMDKELETQQFSRPSGITTAYICTESGQLATGLCEKDPRGSTARWEYFVAGTEPTEYCTVHVEAQICEDSGLFVREGYCPDDTIENKIFIQRPEDMRLNYEELDEETLAHIVDVQYEIPPSMEGEYCNVHGPGMETEEVLDFDLLDLFRRAEKDKQDKDNDKDNEDDD
ncbi:transglycosylase domain-containing protein [Vallitalea okinawensis]|uniref:transglycosylase domain-containing protein n=1 Tax=Vallitalea okinawensis TaxID=2078660 RepID=UPI000CFAFDFF|nr:PBP1A family penicillin-binding protein [Vallitalea okinawensis]